MTNCCNFLGPCWYNNGVECAVYTKIGGYQSAHMWLIMTFRHQMGRIVQQKGDEEKLALRGWSLVSYMVEQEREIVEVVKKVV